DVCSTDLAPPTHAASATRAMIAATGCGDADSFANAEESDRSSSPSVLGVSMNLLLCGLATSVTTDDAEAALADLVHASEMYTTSRVSAGVRSEEHTS